MSKFDCWQDTEHPVHFDTRMFYPSLFLDGVYQNFNEFVLLKKHLPADKSFTLVDVGCATGEISRYLRKTYPQMDYTGCDISKVAVERAKVKYQNAKYIVTDIGLSVLDELKPDYIFSRDVILHQEDPFGFLKQLCSAARKGVFVRLRTRDKGQTVLNVENSCQLNYGQWAPYIVINSDELVNFLTSLKRCSKIVILKNYEILGGWHSRYLPKECYLEETGTAESALYVEIKEGAQEPEISIETSQEDVSVPFVCKAFSRILRMTVGQKQSRVWW